MLENTYDLPDEIRAYDMESTRSRTFPSWVGILNKSFTRSCSAKSMLCHYTTGV